MQVVTKQIADLIFAEYNPRQLSTEQYEHIKSSLLRFGFVDPIIVNVHKDRKNTIIGGHQRVKVWKDLGNTDVPAVELKLTLDKERELNVRLNKNVGSWDWDGLADNFEVAELVDWGFTKDELEIGFNIDTEPVTEDTPPPVPEDPITERGQIYQLGRHRLLCGDATSAEDVARLMDGETADFSFCDPTYNLGFKYNSYDDNKTAEEYATFCRTWFALLEACSDRQCVTLGTKNIALAVSLGDLAGVGCWVKKNWITGCSIAHLQQWEPLCFFGDYTKHKRTSDLYEINRVVQEDVGSDHTCPKQIKLIVDILLAYSEHDVVDFFGGSGTTLIACEQIHRTCCMMELDPRYCDVIVQRYANLVGTDVEPIFETGVHHG